jgi:hypothetical protein
MKYHRYTTDVDPIHQKLYFAHKYPHHACVYVYERNIQHHKNSVTRKTDKGLKLTSGQQIATINGTKGTITLPPLKSLMPYPHQVSLRPPTIHT